VKPVPLSRSTSESSFHSCNDEAEEETDDSDVNEEYTWTTPTVIIHNILLGRLWCEFQGQIDIKHTQSNRHALLTIKSLSWFTSQSTKVAEMFKYTGFILDGETRNEDVSIDRSR
jgi:Oxysterol-binding protein